MPKMRKPVAYFSLFLGGLAVLALFGYNIVHASVLLGQQTSTSAYIQVIDVNSAGSGTTSNYGSGALTTSGNVEYVELYVEQYFSMVSQVMYLDMTGPSIGTTCHLETDSLAANPGGYANLGAVPFEYVSGDCDIEADDTLVMTVGQQSHGSGGDLGATIRVSSVGGAGTSWKYNIYGVENGTTGISLDYIAYQTGEYSQVIVSTSPTATTTSQVNGWYVNFDVGNDTNITASTPGIVRVFVGNNSTTQPIFSERYQYTTSTSNYAYGAIIPQTNIFTPGTWWARAEIYDYATSSAVGATLATSSLISFVVPNNPFAPYPSGTVTNPLSEESLNCDAIPIFESVEFDFVVGEISIPWPADTFVEGLMCQWKLAVGQVGDFLFVPGEDAQAFWSTALGTYQQVFPFNFWFTLRNDISAAAITASDAPAQDLGYTFAQPGNNTSSIPLFNGTNIADVFTETGRNVWYNMILTMVIVFMSFEMFKMLYRYFHK